MRRLVLTTLALVALGAATSTAAHPDDQCILTRLLQGHTVGDDGHTLYFGVNGTEVYQVTTSGPCLAHATGSDPIIVRDRGLGKICKPLDLEIIARGTQCGIDKLTKLTPEQAQALPKRLQP